MKRDIKNMIGCLFPWIMISAVMIILIIQIIAVFSLR